MSNDESRGLFDLVDSKANYDMLMAKRKGTTYVVDDAWRKRVETRLSEKGWRRADLAREARVSKSTITELLNGTTNECVRLSSIHSALGWDAPLPPILSNDASELFGIWDRLNEFEKGRLLERARAIFEQQTIASRKP
jgi:transcriptional regulator with XRE-family HTH domain